MSLLSKAAVGKLARVMANISTAIANRSAAGVVLPMLLERRNGGNTATFCRGGSRPESPFYEGRRTEMKPAIGKSVIARALFLGLLAAATSGQEIPVRDWKVPAFAEGQARRLVQLTAPPFAAISPPCRLYDSRVSSGGPGPIPASGIRSLNFSGGSPACGPFLQRPRAVALHHGRRTARPGVHLCLPDGNPSGDADFDHQLQRGAGRAEEQRGDPRGQRLRAVHDRDGRSRHRHHHRHQRSLLYEAGD